MRRIRRPRDGVLLTARGLFVLSKALRRWSLERFFEGVLGGRLTCKAQTVADALSRVAARLVIHEVTRDETAWGMDPDRRPTHARLLAGCRTTARKGLVPVLLVTPVATARVVGTSPSAGLAVPLALASTYWALLALVSRQRPTDPKLTNWDVSVILTCSALGVGSLGG